MNQLPTLLLQERAQRVLWAAGHGHLLDHQLTCSRPLMAMCKAIDPLVDIDRIFIKDGNIWTSAGMTAGIDLALALIEDDFGPTVAKSVARDLVVYHRRLGGQSQFSAMLDITPTSGRVRDALCYARDHLSETLSVERLAEVACVSSRQFSRIFFDATGTTPAKAIERLRLEVARPRIEETAESLEIIARDVGFATAEKMCRSCVSVFGRTPQELRRTARKLDGRVAKEDA